MYRKLLIYFFSVKERTKYSCDFCAVLVKVLLQRKYIISAKNFSPRSLSDPSLVTDVASLRYNLLKFRKERKVARGSFQHSSLFSRVFLSLFLKKISSVSTYSTILRAFRVHVPIIILRSTRVYRVYSVGWPN